MQEESPLTWWMWYRWKGAGLVGNCLHSAGMASSLDEEGEEGMHHHHSSWRTAAAGTVWSWRVDERVTDPMDDGPVVAGPREPPNRTGRNRRVDDDDDAAVEVAPLCEGSCAGGDVVGNRSFSAEGEHSP